MMTLVLLEFLIQSLYVLKWICSLKINLTAALPLPFGTFFTRGLDIPVRAFMKRKDEDHYKRVILHLDLDCFYAQVEHNRLKIPLNIPLAVQQWNGLIAGKLIVIEISNIKLFSQLCCKRCWNKETRFRS
jgi:hypothetical protein